MKASRRYETGMTSAPTLASTIALATALLMSPPVATGRAELLLVDSSQQDEARDAVRQGLVRPLEQVLAEVRKTIKGDIVEIEFEKDDGRFIYEIEYVAPDGHLMEIKIDAQTLAVISIGEEDED